MCNRFRVSAKQMEIAKQFGFPIDTLMPGPEPLPPPELFPRKSGWIARKQDGDLSLDVMKWGIPRRMTGKSGKPIVNHITNVRNRRYCQKSPVAAGSFASIASGGEGRARIDCNRSPCVNCAGWVQ